MKPFSSPNEVIVVDRATIGQSGDSVCARPFIPTGDSVLRKIMGDSSSKASMCRRVLNRLMRKSNLPGSVFNVDSDETEPNEEEQATIRRGKRRAVYLMKHPHESSNIVHSIHKHFLAETGDEPNSQDVAKGLDLLQPWSLEHETSSPVSRKRPANMDDNDKKPSPK